MAAGDEGQRRSGGARGAVPMKTDLILKSELNLRSRGNRGGYLLTEALVNMGLLVVVLALGYQAMYRCVDASVVLRRNADDIARALDSGERWRADIRRATRGASLATPAGGLRLTLLGQTNRVEYRFADESVLRRLDAGPWVRILERVKASSFEREARAGVAGWRW